MKITEYLQRKYGAERPTTLTYTEAKVFGIRYPLEHGWYSHLVGREISLTMWASLWKALQKRATGKHQAKAASARRGLAVLAGHAELPKLSPVPAASDDFLSSYAWRRVRMEALKRHGARCQCCGASPADGAVMNVDHIKPRKLFPSLALDVENLQVLCEACNHGKGNWDQTDWRPDESVNVIPFLREIAKHG